MLSATAVGSVGKDAETKFLEKGSVTSFSVATEAYSKGENKTTWVNVSIFGKRGESVAQYIIKGGQVAATGVLTQREYTKKDGSIGYSLDLNANEVKLLGKRAATSGTEAPAKGETTPTNSADFTF